MREFDEEEYNLYMQTCTPRIRNYLKLYAKRVHESLHAYHFKNKLPVAVKTIMQRRPLELRKTPWALLMYELKSVGVSCEKTEVRTYVLMLSDLSHESKMQLLFDYEVAAGADELPEFKLAPLKPTTGLRRGRPPGSRTRPTAASQKLHAQILALQSENKELRQKIEMVNQTSKPNQDGD